MKRWLVVLVLMLVGFVSASVEVHNYSVGLEYAPSDNLTGEINFTIKGEDYDSKITSNDGGEISLGEFFERNGIADFCIPKDCSKNYEASGGALENVFSISPSIKKELGFVLNGSDVVLNSLSFKIESDFGEGSKVPLVVDFFGREDWMFDEFSETSFLDKNYGCYNSSSGVADSFVGKGLYCEMIGVSNSKRLFVGAKVGGSGNVNLTMTIYPESGIGGGWSCNYNPSLKDGCFADAGYGEIFSGGDYQVCVGASKSTGYRIFQESSGENCGFAYVSGPEGSTKDYAIFAQGMKYADAGLLGDVDFDFEGMVLSANKVIEDRYEGDCSGGCVLPLTFSGVLQDARIYDVELWYTEDNQLKKTNEVYDLEGSPVLIDYSGVLDLEMLGFGVSKAMDYIVSLDGVRLFKKEVELLAIPIVLFVSPTKAPAVVPVNFYVDVDFNWSMPLSYEWNFGDGKSSKTSEPNVVHSYLDLKNYSLSVKVSAGKNLSSTKTFSIEVISPEDAIVQGLFNKRNSLNKVSSVLSGFPLWYRTPLSNIINMSYFESELDRLDKANNNSGSSRKPLEIAEDIYALNVPAGIGVNREQAPYLMTELNDIDVEVVSVVGGSVNDSSNPDYVSSILNWQVTNVDVSFLRKDFSVLFSNGKKDGVLTVYSFNVSSRGDEESYFVIGRSLDELHFNRDVGAKKVGGSTVIVLSARGSKSFEFYYEGVEPASFFVSPKLSSILLESNIDFSCNHNLICEDGEDSDGCRSDCKPLGKTILYTGLALLFVLILYSLLQAWYKYNYEGHLFGDRKQLYNLLMYVANARAKGFEDLRIKVALRKSGWSSERVNYVVKKSQGENVGLPELIPFGRISAFFRNRKAARSVASRDVRY